MRCATVPPLLAALLCLAAGQAFAQTDDCPYTRELSARVEMPPATPLRLKAGAGSLVVRGVDGLREARVRGTVCATSSALAEEAWVRAEREAGAVSIETMMPELVHDFTSNVFVRVDLIVEVPRGTPAAVHDGGGSAELSGLGDVEVQDGSGALLIEDMTGRVEVHDGSGEVEIRRATGPVQVHDGSGEVVIRDVGGDVRIHDGSGSIDVDGVRGNLVVTEDGSGSLEFANVAGRVDVPRRGRGRHR